MRLGLHVFFFQRKKYGRERCKDYGSFMDYSFETKFEVPAKKLSARVFYKEPVLLYWGLLHLRIHKILLYAYILKYVLPI